MITLHFVALALLLASAPIAVAVDQSSRSIAPCTVVIPSGTLRLKAFPWRPTGPAPFPAVLFCHGSGSTDAGHTGELEIIEAAERLGPVLVKHGYAFLFLFRRGQGLSADQGKFMQDLLQREKAAHGDEARKRLQFRLLTTDHLDDVLAGLSFLKSLSGVDAHRIASQDTRLVVNSPSSQRSTTKPHEPRSLSALRRLLLGKVHRITQAFVECASQDNRSSHAASRRERLIPPVPGKAMTDELARLGTPRVLKIYQPIGQTSDDGHMAVYTAVDQWEDDVFEFLDGYFRRY